jgi:hypothetical protein
MVVMAQIYRCEEKSYAKKYRNGRVKLVKQEEDEGRVPRQ